MEEVTPFIIISPLTFSPEGEMQVTLIRVFILDQCPSPQADGH